MHEAALERLLRLGGELYTPPGQPRRKFDLDHMRRLLRELGHPEQRFRSVLIAGTNGKGSTSAALASVLAAAGHSAGLYTSPHLFRVHERIQFSQATAHGFREIDDGELFSCFAEVERAAGRLVERGELPGPPSFFEAVTAVALLAFARHGVEWAVLEVGMGGRLDATNAVEPSLSVITDISLDHTEWLGTTLEEITREKAGILRPGGLLVTLPQHMKVNQALGEVAVPLAVRGLNAAELLPGRELAADSTNDYTLALGPEWGALAGPLRVEFPLAGSHQRRNLALALTAALALHTHFGVALTREALEQGVRRTAWPGRLERIAADVDRPEVLLDVAHNPAGAWTLRAALRADEDRPKALIFGCMADKALREMAQVLFPLFPRVFLVELPSPRSASLAELREAAEAAQASYAVAATAAEALELAAAELKGQPDALVVGAGSVVLVGELRARLLVGSAV
jgi:dihydrofolate synthase / folylpolyglutamate synthase